MKWVRGGGEEGGGLQLPRPNEPTAQHSQPACLPATESTGIEPINHHNKTNGREDGNVEAHDAGRTIPLGKIRETAQTETPYLNWRGCPGSTSLPSAHPSAHHHHHSFFNSFLIRQSGGGGATHRRQPTCLARADPPPPPSPNCSAVSTSHTHPPMQPTGYRLEGGKRHKKMRVCGIARQQTDKGWGAWAMNLAATCSQLGVAAATFRNPFGGFRQLGWMAVSLQ